jgi:ribosomal-protein-alanine N-acetyltransferase
MTPFLRPPVTWLDAPAWGIRNACEPDRTHIERLIDSARWRHQHLDWSDALSLLGSEPFLLACERGRPVACLACPPDHPDLTWVRLFALAGGRDLSAAWSSLCAESQRKLREMGVKQVWALATYTWLPPLLAETGFLAAGGVVFLECDGAPTEIPRLSLGRIRPLTPADWPGVLALDQRAFEPAWALSTASLHAAASQAAIATVIDADGRLLGYQISTRSAYGVHLARLAVDPDVQAHGLGACLVADTLTQAGRMGMPRVSVNTQSDNSVSRRLYVRMGFRETGQEFPVFRLDLAQSRAAIEASHA